MVKSRKRQLTLAELCRTHGATLQDLADISGVSLASIKQLEQHPPTKANTWEIDWKKRVSQWIPFFKHAFHDVFKTRAFADCPKEVVENLLAEYDAWRAHDDNTEPQRSSYPQARELELLSAIAELDAKWDWAKEEVLLARVARLFPCHDSRWAEHRLTMSQMHVNRGELDSAEQIISQTLAEHTSALHQAGRTADLEPEPRIRTLVEVTRAWSHFLKGDWAKSRAGFEQAMLQAQYGRDNDLLGRAAHMGGRAWAEPYLISAYFQPDRKENHADLQLNKALLGFELDLELDGREDHLAAFNNCYEGVIYMLRHDHATGKKLLNRADAKLRGSDMRKDALTHPAITLRRFEILGTAWDNATYQRCETAFSDTFPYQMAVKYPYAVAEMATTIVDCRIRRNKTADSPQRQRESADLLVLALIAHPYPQHTLWQVAMERLAQAVLPTFSDRERLKYIQGLASRVTNGEGHFGYLTNWQIDLHPLQHLLHLLTQPATTPAFSV